MDEKARTKVAEEIWILLRAEVDSPDCCQALEGEANRRDFTE